MKRQFVCTVLLSAALSVGCTRNELDSAVVISTAEVTEITSETAVSGGVITSDGGSRITAYGVCWSVKDMPTIADSKTEDGAGTGEWVSQITGLTPGETYHVRAYGVNTNGVAYGDVKTFVAAGSVPIVTTTAVSAVESGSAVSGGRVTFDGGEAIDVVGVCWSTEENPTIEDDHTEDILAEDNTFVSHIEGLEPDRTYYLRAYAVNSSGTGYGDQIVFGTSTEPVVEKVQDPAIWAYILENYDTSNDGNIQVSEAEAATLIDVPNAGVKTIAGLEQFTNLTEIRLNGNALTSIDLTPFTKLERFNGIENPDLAEVNIKGLRSLAYIHCHDTSLSSLDLSDAVSIVELHLFRTNLETLDLTYCPALSILNLDDTPIRSVDASDKQSLTYLNVSNCKNIESVDVKGCTSLAEFYVGTSSLKEIDASGLPSVHTIHAFNLVSENAVLRADDCPSLKYLHAYGSNLSVCSARNCPALVEYRCYGNPGITEVDFTGSFKSEAAEINLDGSMLTSFKIDKDNSVKYLNLAQNRLLSLDLTGGFTSLEQLYLNFSTLESIDMSGLPKLWDFNSNDNVSANALSVKADNCPELVNMICFNAHAREISTKNCPKLVLYRCYGNPDITSVDLTGCEAVEEINLDGSVLENMVLPVNAPALWYVNIHKNMLTSVDLSGYPALTALHCGNAKLLTSVKYPASIKEIYHFNNPKLETVDVSGLSALTTLWSYGDDYEENRSGLKNLVFSGNSNLTVVRAFRTEMESVDIRSCADHMAEAWFDANTKLKTITKRASQVIDDLHVDAGCEVVEL